MSLGIGLGALNLARGFFARSIETSDLARYGDHNTRFKSVYTATDSDPVGWYLPDYPH